MSILVAANRLSKQFIDASGVPFNAVDELTLTVKAGQLTALVGPDGAGKTTLMRMIAGLLKPTEGTLTVLDTDISLDPQSVQDRISYMPQRFGLYEDLSVQENLTLYADLHNVPLQRRQQRFERLLQLTDLARFTDRPAGKLSGGMKQKLGLACTLVRSPDLLLLDEPSVGVDPLSRRELWKIIQQLVHDEQLSVIVSTAYMDEAERCQQVYVMHHGKTLASGSPDELRHRADGLTLTMEPPAETPARNVQARLLDARELIIDAVPAGGAVRFSHYPDADSRQLDQLYQPLPVSERPTELEDAFMMLLREHSDGSASQKSVNQNPAPTTGPTTPAPDFQVIKQDDTHKPAIEVRNLVRTFGDFTAVASTSFSVQRGEIFGLLGPNGAGKTTTFRMLCGLLPASSGFLEVAGVNLLTARAKARGRIGYVSQKFALYSNLTVLENLEFFGGAYGLRGKHLRQRIQHTLEQFQLDPKASSGKLPAGYKQRLAMATGLLHQPDILFLDEPTSGIDPLARRDFWRTITSLAQQGVTIIITTHFMEEAEYCDRIAIQDAGKLLALGTPREVRELAGDGYNSNMNDAFIAIVEMNRDRLAQQESRNRASQPQEAST
ncbi:ATP-binding cassette domain-containing protein [Oceanobacter mangrovi]|uniref:ATP-binding cassette domain-containing protein n=1 Tax=Oceanobacter mangrovi TaxID=2862510 RepID=UPI001C8D2164|nr:ATP-binding cassette domain-containing protein [Oceanobacter mangrovi]